MSDVGGLPTVGPKHSRSTSITTSKKTTSHQRKPSLNQNIQLPSSTPTSEKRHSNSHRPTLGSSVSSSNVTATTTTTSANTPTFLYSLISRVHAFLNPSGPLLPHAKHGAAFGGTSKISLFSSLFQSRFMRFVALFYVIFSVFLTLNHSWNYLLSSNQNVSEIRSVMGRKGDEQFGDDWIPQRTYDQG
jgi:hypothetical protein